MKRSLLAATLVLLAFVGRANDAPTSSTVRPTERLVVKFEAGSFRLLSRIPLTKAIPASEELPASDRPLSGFWYELQSGNSQVKYRRIVANPVRVHVEGVEPAEGSSPQRAETMADGTVFSLLVPAAAAGDQLVLFSSPLTPGGESQPARVVARIPLSKVAK